jgi:polyisoprenoid-binding protein YceI
MDSMAWVVDPAHTTVGFRARHMGLATVRGRFTKFSGTVEGDPGDITTAKARFEIDAASIDTGDERRDGHMRSPDFFDVESHPKITFETKSITPKGDDRYTVVGTLTIKGVTRELELEYEHAGGGTDPFGNRKFGGNLSGTITRTDWDLTWNVPLDSGGWLVSDKITIDIDVEVTESAEAAEESAEAEATTSA